MTFPGRITREFEAGEVAVRGREKGAAALEFALVAPLLLALVFGIFEFGRAVWLYQAVSASSREAARYGIGIEGGSGSPQYLDCDGIRDAARDRAPDLDLADSDIVITFRHGDGTSSTCDSSPEVFDGDLIEVQVTTELDINLPLVPLEELTISATDARSVFPGISR